MRLASKLAILILVSAFLPAVIVGYLAYDNGRRTIINESIEHLTSINSYKSNDLKHWVEASQGSLEELAQRPLVRLLTESLMKHEAPDRLYQKAKKDFLEDHLQPRLKYGNFLELFLICPQQGLTLISTDERQEGKNKNHQPYFLEGRSRTTIQHVYYSPGLEQPTMIISTPIIDKQGNLLGVLAGRLDLGKLSRIIEQRPVKRRIENTYLVNVFNFFVTEPRFGRKHALRKTVHTEGVAAGLSGKNGVGFYQDYRGQPTIGAYLWLPEFKMVIVTEVDQQEAFAPVVHLLWTISVIAVGVFVAAGLVTLFFAGTMTRPIRRLAAGAEKIGQGNLEFQVGTEVKDEIGQLSRVLDRMAESLKKTTVSRDVLLEEMAKRKLAEESLRATSARQEALLSAIPDIILEVDVNKVYTWANQPGLDFFGDEVIGKPAEFYFEGEQTIYEMVQPLFDGGEKVIYVESWQKRQDGQKRFLAWWYRVLKDPAGNVTGALSSGRDITEHKRAEEALQEIHQELEKRNEELTRFIYTVSHDLKSPLVTIKTFLGYLEQDVQKQNEERMDQDLTYIRTAADKMSQLLDELLDLSRIGRMIHPPVETTLQAIVQEALDLVAGQIIERGAQIQVTEDPVLLYGDRPRLVEIFQNLVDNAVKFMGDQPNPRVEIGVEEFGEELALFIRDNGIGIDPLYQSKLFGLFEKLDPHTEGTGIGLSLVQRIVEVHGGRIWMESEGIGKGACFRFTLAGTRKA